MSTLRLLKVKCKVKYPEFSDDDDELTFWFPKHGRYILDGGAFYRVVAGKRRVYINLEKLAINE